MNHSLRRGALLMAMLMSAALTSCAPPSVEVRALPPVNTNSAGESLPVKVRIYALRDDARFRSAPLADLWTKDREVLGDDRLQDPKVVVVAPTSLQTDPQVVELSELPTATRFLGVVALIQHPDQPDRRRLVIARKDIGSQIIEILDSSIVLHSSGDPLPGRTPAPAPAATTSTNHKGGSATASPAPATAATAPTAAPVAPAPAPAANPAPATSSPASTTTPPAASPAPAAGATQSADSTQSTAPKPVRGRGN